MSEVCRLIIPVDPNDCTPNRRRNLRGYIRAKKAHKLAAQAIWINAGRPVADGKVRVHAVVRRGRTMDDDNVWAGLKPVRDGLFKNAITKDDGRQYVEIGTLQMETGDRWKRCPEVEIVVEAI